MSDRSKKPPCASLCRYGLEKGEYNAEGCTGSTYHTLVDVGTNKDGFDTGHYVQLCPHPDRLDRRPSSRTWCGDGPDDLLLHGTELPSLEEIRETIAELDL